MRSKRSSPPEPGQPSIGFGAMVAGPDDRRTGEIFRDVEPEDLLKYGLIPEFVGRLPVVAPSKISTSPCSSSANEGHGVDPLAPSTCWPYGGSVPLNRAQKRQLLSLYTLPPSACTSVHIFES
jgi:hypothetical protein